ncbi:MAG TPA: tetratricopeptide repeat protein [Gemmataceae bacterium]|nr:tetratricopeptide repeat protein [Gemmataceae bacterium]
MTLPPFAVSTGVVLGIVGAVLVSSLLGAVLWLVFGRAPRRQRAYKRGQRFLHEGEWEEGLAAAREVLRLGRMPRAWEGRLRNLQGECHHVAGDQALKAKGYEEALKHYAVAADFLSLTEAEFRTRVGEAMLSEALRQFAAGPPNNEATQALLARLLKIQPGAPAATFWQGLCHLRDGRTDLAQAAFSAAHETGGRGFIDPPLYLGMVLLREGKPQEALRALSEANRIDANCPFVPLHMGQALVAANGDAGLAVRALQRSLSQRGLLQWVKTPEKVWADAMPENRSYIRRLAAKYDYTCPLLGKDLLPAINRGRMALGQALYRLGQYSDAADLYAKLLQDAPPTLEVLRAHGLALAKLERYDQAYKQLRIALEQEPRDLMTAGYLALCGALGKPTQEEDRPRNVAWSIRLLSKYEKYGDPEFAALFGRVYAEARALDMAVSAEDQLRLCDVLASVFAIDPESAAAYDHLAATHPEALRPEHAWIYCQAAHQHGLKGQCDLDMFSRTFHDAEHAAPFYGQRSWDFEAVEFTYLERAAKGRPGRFPAELGEDYADRGTSRLLARSRRQEEEGNKGAALATAEVLLALAPRNVLAHDRVARLCYQGGDLDRAVALLTAWHGLEPSNHVPLLRRAVIEGQRGNPAGRTEALRQALDLTQGAQRAAIAILGARLALAAVGQAFQPDAASSQAGKPDLPTAETLLQEALRAEDGNAEALWLLAAVRSTADDHDGLAALAPAMNQPQVPDARFHYLAAVCFLAARDYPQVLEACRRAWGEASLLVECRYLMGWAHLHLGDEAAAIREWEVVARTTESPSAEHARALLGRLRFGRGEYEEAFPWWTGLDPERRGAWGLDEPLRGTMFLAGLLALGAGRYEQAAERFRDAGKLGLRDRRLGPLMTLALVKAGQEKLFSGNGQVTEGVERVMH